MKAGIIGASGYTGAELLRLLAGHPEIEVAVVTAHAHAGQVVGEHTPSLAAAYPGLVYEGTDPERMDGLDLVFCALPHGESQRIVPRLRDRVGVIVDLAADFRLQDAGLYPTWYGEEHAAPALLDRGRLRPARALPSDLAGATLVAAAGLLPDRGRPGPGAPAAAPGWSRPTGSSSMRPRGSREPGAAPKDSLHFGAVDEDFVAYGLLTHRHTPEMEQILGAQVLFTPHLAPMARGILATCYARPAAGAGGLTTDDVMGALHAAYDDEPFVVVTDQPPSTKATTGSNCAHVTARVDPRTGWVLSLCALDNLVKGASGQAIQCANVALGPSRDVRAPARGAVPVSVTAPDGLRGRRGLGRHQGRRRARRRRGGHADGRPVAAAGVFTSNLAAAAPVQVSRAHLAGTGGRAAGVILTSGNANAATGQPGREAASAALRS